METQASAPVIAKKGTFPANVADIINPLRLVINRGENDGIRLQQRVLVYSISNEEIKDPNTGESLGHLEIVKGTGRIVHLQDKLATIESDKTRSYLRKLVSPYSVPNAVSLLREQEVIEVSEPVPFESPEVGDFVKPI
jgi:hypothetical protein